jgi:hypothetical protein
VVVIGWRMVVIGWRQEEIYALLGVIGLAASTPVMLEIAPKRRSCP